jgi:hypothetical protein
VTVEYTFTCTLCRTKLTPPTQCEALRWDGKSLVRDAYWPKAPLHLCTDCIKAVAEFAEQLRIEE